MLQRAETMKSPITGGRMTLEWEWREMEFRKETWRVMFPYYKCADTGEQFTTTDSDGVWLAQVRNQYCRKYGIPYMDEIVAVRERYGLSAAKMSAILGFGPNQWRKYEQEEVPNVSNGRMIRSIMNPQVFLDMVDSAREVLTDREYEKIRTRVQQLVADSDRYHIEQYETKRVFAVARGPENGYGQLSLTRLKNVMLFVLERSDEVWTTKMNKLLFYIDFMAYRERGMAITGLSYRAIDFGPGPERGERVYSQFDEVRQETRAVGDFEGNVLTADVKADKSVFSAEELELMERVCRELGGCSSRMLSDMSHQEKGWIENHQQHAMIPFEDAFALNPSRSVGR